MSNTENTKLNRLLARARPAGECLIWTGCTRRADGYGCVNAQTYGFQMVHRAVLSLSGVNVSGFEVHHTCGVRLCIRLEHLMLIRPGDHRRMNSWAAKTHCPQGHPYGPENTYRGPDGRRHCRICGRKATLAWYHRTRS